MGCLRFLLALSVVASHGGAILGTTLIGGSLAVEVFFVISGFYMSLILQQKYFDRSLFYTNRFLRLYPAYLTVLLLSWAWFFFTWRYLGKRPPPYWTVDAYADLPLWQAILIQFSNWFMLGVDLPSLFHYKDGVGFILFHNYYADDAPDGSHWAGRFVAIYQAWSIGIEIWFYLLVPFIVKLRVFSLSALAFLSIGIKVWMEWKGLQSYFFFPANLYLFIVGIFLHRIHQIQLCIAHVTLILVIVPIVAVTLFANYIPDVLRRYAVYAAFIPAIPFLFSATKGSSIDLFIGNLSYPLYIGHAFVISAFKTLTHLDNGALNACVAVIFAILLYIIVDNPVDHFRQSRVLVRQKEGTIGNSRCENRLLETR